MRQWWTVKIFGRDIVKIFGRDVGVVVEHWRANPIAPDVYEVSVTHKRAMRDGWHDEPSHDVLDDCDLETIQEISRGAHETEEAARREAIDYYCTNCVVLAASHTDSMRHNTEMIRTLSETPS
jgi:hypothetical protein